jgi:glycerophosphoryl diester phosphodiesterase
VQLAESNWQQLQSLDLGSWFHPDFRDQRLMTLEQLLDDFGTQCRLMLEIKCVPTAQDAAQKFLFRLAQAVTARSLQSRVAILCFDALVLERFQQLAPWAVCVLNVDRPQDLTADHLQRRVWLKAVDSNIRNLQAAHVELFQKHQLVPMCYTCNSEADVLKAWTLGVAAIITNDPERTRTILAKIMQSHAT